MADTATPTEVEENDVVTVLPASPDGPYDVDHDISEDDLLRMHRIMTLARALDVRGTKYQRQGRLGFYLGATGEEALAVGSAFCTRPDDWIFPHYRIPAGALWRGADLDQMIANCFGNADDNGLGRQMPVHYSMREVNWVSVSSPLGTQIVQAAGCGRAIQLAGTDQIVMTSFGDGSTSTNDFHTGMNFAGVWGAPVIFLCQNNGWAISTPLSEQCAAEKLSDKAIGYGIPAIRVDGNDLLAVVQATQEAVARARSGGGPTFIEALSYRMGPHSSSDDPTRYRPEGELETWALKDPILRIRRYLLATGAIGEDEIASLEEECAEEVLASFKRNEDVGKPPLESLFTDVYGEMPEHLAEQSAYLMAVEGGQVREDTSGAAFPL